MLQAAGRGGGGDDSGWPLPVFLPSSLQLDLVDLERVLATAMTTVHLLGGSDVLHPLVGELGLGVVRLSDVLGGVGLEGRDDLDVDHLGEVHGT